MDAEHNARFADTPGLSRRTRGLLLAAIVLGHLGLGAALIAAYDIAALPSDRAARDPAFVAVAIRNPPPPERAHASHVPSGASGATARKATADQVIAPPTRVPVPAMAAPPVAGSGSDTRSGASATGEGTGGAGNGGGPGSGGAGQGAGAGQAAPPVKIGGDLTETDYPKAGRAKRIGTSVVVILTIDAAGQVTDCRIDQPSGDPQADTITCTLARRRFRFHPALDRTGAPVAAMFGWRQSFFAQ